MHPADSSRVFPAFKVAVASLSHVHSGLAVRQTVSIHQVVQNHFAGRRVHGHQSSRLRQTETETRQIKVFAKEPPLHVRQSPADLNLDSTNIARQGARQSWSDTRTHEFPHPPGDRHYQFARAVMLAISKRKGRFRNEGCYTARPRMRSPTRSTARSIAAYARWPRERVRTEPGRLQRHGTAEKRCHTSRRVRPVAGRLERRGRATRGGPTPRTLDTRIHASLHVTGFVFADNLDAHGFNRNRRQGPLRRGLPMSPA